jgi:hypothetical protein
MLDPIFGSHYVQSAIDLAIRAFQQANPPAGVEPNNDEAIRLYSAAHEDADLAVKDLEKLQRQLPHWRDMMTEMRQRQGTWLTTIEQLQQRQFLREPTPKRKRRRSLTEIHGADRIPAGDLARIVAMLREGKQIDAGELLSMKTTEYGLKSYEVFHLGQHLLKEAEVRRVGGGVFVVDEANCDDMAFYVDIMGKGSVQILVTNEGLSINVYPFTVQDIPAGHFTVSNAKLAGT